MSFFEIQGPSAFMLAKYQSDLARGATDTANRQSTDLANTAHQREVADLKAAGLNPILSAMGGSGAPSPQMQAAPVTTGSASADPAAEASSAIQAVNAARAQDAGIKSTQAQTAATNATALQTLQNTSNLKSQADIIAGQKKLQALSIQSGTTSNAQQARDFQGEQALDKNLGAAATGTPTAGAYGQVKAFGHILGGAASAGFRALTGQ